MTASRKQGSRSLTMLARLTVGDIVKAALLVALTFVLLEPALLNALTGVLPLYLLLSQTMDLAIFASVLLLIYSQAMMDRSIRAPELLIVISVLALAVAVSMYVNDAVSVPAVANFKAVARFLLLSWLVANLDWPRMARRTAPTTWGRILLAVTLVQLLIAVLQRLYGGFFLDAFSFQPISYGGIDINQQTLKLGAAMGTLGRPIGLAMYAMVTGVLAVVFLIRGQGGKVVWALLFCASFLLVVLSMKRSAMVLFVGIPFIGYALIGRSRGIFNLAMGVVFLCLLTGFLVLSQLELSEGEIVRGKEVRMTPLQSIQQLTVEEFWRHTLRVSRGWVLTTVGTAAIRETPPLGFSMDPIVAQQALAEAADLSRLEGYRAFQDVYWVSLWTFIGPVGMLIFLAWFLLLVVRIHRNQSGHSYSALAAAAMTLLVLMVPLLFVERVIEVKSFSFFAFFIFGLAASRSFFASGSQDLDGKDHG